MRLWIAVKHEPLYLVRNPLTHEISWRLNQWWLPSFLHLEYACHVEIVLTHACTGPQAACTACAGLPLTAARDQFEHKHYITYSVDRKRNKVYRSTARHILPPQCVRGNDESWSYYPLPMDARQCMKAFAFLERQLNKPMRKSFELNFLLLCRRNGVLLDSDYDAAESWYCSELASAVLLLCCPHFDDVNVKDPCLISPCALESMLMDIPGVVETSMIHFRAVR
jgi:hypothetical protein